MSKQEGIQIPVMQEDGTLGEPQSSAIGELHIRVYEGGAIELNVPETSKEFTPADIENLTYAVYKQLQEERIASIALQMFKSKLG